MELMEFIKSLGSVSGAVLGFTITVVFLGAYVSFKNDQKNDSINKGVIKIDRVADSTKDKLDKASDDLKNNLDLSQANLDKVTLANEQLLETNQKLSQTSSQLQKNYEGTLKTLEAANKAKDEAIKAQNETLKSKDEIIGQTTGGDSYPSLSLKKGGFYLSTSGTYSIPNLRVSIRLISNCLKIPRKVTLEYLRNQPTDPKYVIPIYGEKYDKLWAGFEFESIDIKNLKSYIPNDDGITHAFEISFKSDYKRWVQRIRIFSHNGKWEVADVLYEIPTTQRDNIFIREEPIYKRVSENFPAIVIDGATKIISFFNAGLDHPTRHTVEFIEYKQGNQVSGCSFDEF